MLWICASIRSVLTVQKVASMPGGVSQNVTNGIFFVCFDIVKYDFGITLDLVVHGALGTATGVHFKVHVIKNFVHKVFLDIILKKKVDF